MTTPCSARRRNTLRTPASLASPIRSATCRRAIGCVVLASTRSTGPSRVGVIARNGWLKSTPEAYKSTRVRTIVRGAIRRLDRGQVVDPGGSALPDRAPGVQQVRHREHEQPVIDR